MSDPQRETFEQRRARILDELESDREAAQEESTGDESESEEREDLESIAAILAAIDPTQEPVRVSFGGPITLSLTPGQLRALDEVAIRQGVSRSQVIRDAISHAVAGSHQ